MPKKPGNSAFRALDRTSVPTDRCAIYTRQSRTRPGVLSSCEVQRDICTDFASPRGWLIVEDCFDDLGESSETLDRPALQRLLREIEAERIDRVVVFSIDRLTRRLRDLHKLLALFEKHGVGLSVVTDPQFGESAASRLMSNIVAAASEFQQDLTRERMAEARAALKRKGRRVAGRVPYGYVADRATKQLVVSRKEADQIRRMFEQAAAGKRPQEIAEFANQQRWQTRVNSVTPGRWTARQVLKVLANPTYAGSIRQGSMTLLGQHQGIVSQELFEQVRQMIQSRRSRTPGRTKPMVAWPLRGLLKCGQCGRAMSPSVSGYKNLQYRYYRCRSNAGGRPPCRDVCLPAMEIEEFVRSTLCGELWREADPTHDDGAVELMTVWRGLEERQQLAALTDIVKEVVFDRSSGTITLTIAGDAVEKLRLRCD